MEDFIYEKTGVRTRIIRFPGGSINRWTYSYQYRNNVRALTELGYIYFDWNTANHDADSDMGYLNEDELMDMTIAEARDRDKIMLLMHDRKMKNATVRSLDNIIEYYKDLGYVFLPITSESFRPQHFDLDDLD